MQGKSEDIEGITSDEARLRGCQHPGCTAGPGLMKFELISAGKSLVSHICPYGHTRYYEIIGSGSPESRSVYSHRNDTWKEGPCSVPECVDTWISKSSERKYCDAHREARNQGRRAEYNIKRRKVKALDQAISRQLSNVT